MNRAAVSFAAVAVLATIAVPAAGKPGAPPGEGRTFAANGVTIWYEVLGDADGTPLVVVNGGPGFDHSYLRVSDAWDRLAQHRPVVLYDQRGNGRSSALEEGQSCTLVDQIDDLDALRLELGRERIDLLGHSWGGYLVMAYATRHPEHVSHLIIADSAAPKWTDTEFIFTYIYPEAIERRSRVDALDAAGDTTAHATSLLEYMGMLCVSREKSDELVARSKDFAYSRKINQLLNADLAPKDLWPALSGFTMPTMVVTGRFDINVAPSTAWKIHKAIPNSRFVVFEKSGHLPFFEEPEAWIETIGQFLDER
jgi:proline iminopeptidase